jgi:BlaR1 peptidase M56
MIPYVLHVTVILTVCFLFYKLLLQKATFYRLNRWTLLGCLALSFILPLLPAPGGWVWRTKAAWSPAAIPGPVVSQAPASTTPEDPAKSIDRMRPAIPSHKKYHVTTKPAVKETAPLEVATSPATIVTLPAKPPATPPPPAHPFRTLLLQGLQLLSYVYGLGLLVFGFKFVGQFFLLCYQTFSRPIIHEGRFRIVQTAGDRGPCTFGNTIFINPALYDRETFRQILVHEKIHVREGHTVDILLAELAVVFQWFNPFAWLYRREVENNLEFLTDRAVLEHPDVERSAYQLSLLRVSAPHLPFSITNNYNQSLLKRRIVMMNTQPSSRHSIWKYFVLLPILTALVCLLNKPAALGQTTAAATAPTAPAAAAAATSPASASPGATAITTATVPAPTVIRAARTTAVIPAAPAVAAPIPDTTVPHPTDDHVHFIESTNIEQGSLIDMRQGTWLMTVDGDDIEIEIRAQSGDGSWRCSFTVRKSEINPYPGQGTVEFKLVRDAGTITFKGSFDGEQGLGHFQFQPDASYFDELRKMGVEDIDDHTENSFFVVNVTRDFVRMLNRVGFTPIRERDVADLAMRKVDEPFLEYWKTSGVEGAGEVHNLFMLKTLHIEPAYVEDLKKAGYMHLNVEQLIQLKRQDIDGNYIRAVNSGSSMPATPGELMVYKMMNIDSGYLASLRKAGYDHLSQSEIRQLSSAHVTADFIKGFRDAGFSDIPVRTLMLLKMRNASPEDAKSFRDLGYSDLDLNQMANLKNEGITPDFINSFHKIGYDKIPVNTLLMLKMSGVDADYVAKMKAKGLNSPDLMKYVQLKREFN